ncbi:MAG: hypothetical protein JXB34_09895 [Bacteroidales bacterium]|nr:hypothetical protein [Bacteroidales bacterium]
MKTTNILCVLIMWACLLPLNAQNAGKLKPLWETRGFDTPESVCFDKQENVYYVSNVGGKNPTAKDGNGFISKMGPEGGLLELKWVDGLNAPKGMAVHNGYLFVTDIDKLVVIDIGIAEIEEEFPLDGALFLNDIAVGKDGALYISDSQAKTFYKFHKGKFTKLLSDNSFDFPNGIIADEKTLVAGIGNSIIKIDQLNGTWTTLIENTGGVDGLAKTGSNCFVISDWSGRIHLVYTDKEKELLLDTTATEGLNAADFYYNEQDSTLLVPTFFSNSVACYQLTIENR